MGYRLAWAGVAPLLLDGWAAHVAAMNDVGLRLAGQFDDAAVRVRAAALDDLNGAGAPPDVVFLCVKSYQTEAAVAKLARHLDLGAIVVSLQNGMNEETIAAAFGRERTVGGVVVMDGAMVGPGVARQVNPDERSFTLGSLAGGPSPAVERAAAVLGRVGEVHISDNVWGELWSKLVHNCMVNAVCALTGLDATRALRDPLVWPFALALGREAVRVSRAEGVVARRQRHVSGAWPKISSTTRPPAASKPRSWGYTPSPRTSTPRWRKTWPRGGQPRSNS